MADMVITHPNRDRIASKTTKAIVVMLLLVTAFLFAVVTFGGWSALQGAQPVAIIYIALCVVMAFFVARWNRGVLPIAAGLAVLFAVVAAVAVPGWFERDKSGFADPALDPGLLGMITVILVPIQLLLLAFAIRAFSQKWNVEVERPRDADTFAAT